MTGREKHLACGCSVEIHTHITVYFIACSPVIVTLGSFSCKDILQLRGLVNLHSWKEIIHGFNNIWHLKRLACISKLAMQLKDQEIM